MYFADNFFLNREVLTWECRFNTEHHTHASYKFTGDKKGTGENINEKYPRFSLIRLDFSLVTDDHTSGSVKP
jgi:hypothetical protein